MHSQQLVPREPALSLTAAPSPFGTSAQPVPASLTQAQTAYAQALALERSQHPASIDYYYAAILASWLAMTSPSPAVAMLPFDPQASAIYHDSLARLILEGQRHGRLDPRRGLTISTTSGQLNIPTRYFGFSWQPADFHQLVVVGDYGTERPRNVYRRPGLGVPLVVMRYQNGVSGFFGEQHPFPATAILRPAVRWAGAVGSPAVSDAGNTGPSLDFYDSVTIRQVSLAGKQLDLAGDITAPFAVIASQAERIKLSDRLLPGSSTNPAQLHFVEPYRPGKIPVVLVHGLLSDPSTWADSANELRAVPQICERFQFWAFRYPTSTSLMESATALREQLQLAVATVDPHGTDPALRQMVLIGHSMGGLLSKLQVTYSGSAIWSRIANRPLETIVADERIKARLRRDAFFEPSPFVRRVVFVGTPHRGSSIASTCIGRITSSFVDPSPEATQIHQMLIQSNPNTFSADIRDGFPNSIDMLEPTSSLLAALQQMPVNPQVRLHSIIGHGHPMLCDGDSDGVVPVSSARHPGVQTETLVRAWHTEVQRHPDTVTAMLYILSMHYADYQAALGQ